MDVLVFEDDGSMVVEEEMEVEVWENYETDGGISNENFDDIMIPEVGILVNEPKNLAKMAVQRIKSGVFSDDKLASGSSAEDLGIQNAVPGAESQAESDQNQNQTDEGVVSENVRDSIVEDATQEFIRSNS